MYAACVGDSAVILGKVDPIKGIVGEMVTKPHRPNVKEESDRIIKCGGKVKEIKNVLRVIYELDSPEANDESQKHNQLPKLNLTRSLGDLWSFIGETEGYLISPIPDVFVRCLDPAVHKYIILVSDGVLDVMDHNACVELIHSESKGNVQKRHEAAEIAEKLLEAAIKKWRDKKLAADNVSAITAFIIAAGDMNHVAYYKNSQREVFLT